ncbi:hypothetical protein ACMA1D_25280 [Streptomyces sp. 796.1]|uniref:hypothetical protein n=1 Tax=Streptomyces sp. 796.1 TaxID=3163029 RepID=UPI0039C9A99B
MGQLQTIRRWIRIAGAAYCALFAAISLAWIIRDLRRFGGADDLWWNWSGFPGQLSYGPHGSAYQDLLLLVLYVTVGVIAVRSAVAGSALVTVAVATVGLRLPGLWNLHTKTMDYVPDGLLTRARLTCWAEVLASVALLAAVLSGRRGARSRPQSQDSGAHASDAYRPAPYAAAAPYEERAPWAPPARPTQVGATIGLFALAGAGVAMIGWQLYVLSRVHWHTYQKLLVDVRFNVSLLDQPPAWETWFVALLAVVAGCAALRRAPSVRPLGTIAAFLVGGFALMEFSLLLRFDIYDYWSELPTNAQVRALLAPAEVVAGLVALLALARRGPEVPGSAQGPEDARGGAAPQDPVAPAQSAAPQ